MWGFFGRVTCTKSARIWLCFGVSEFFEESKNKSTPVNKTVWLFDLAHDSCPATMLLSEQDQIKAFQLKNFHQTTLKLGPLALEEL